MDAETLLNEFELLLDAPDSVPKLREMILNLAMRGKLTEQDPSDEPAEALLERIEVARDHLYESGEIRKPKKLQLAGDDVKPFNLPESWKWVRVRGLFDSVSTRGKKVKASEYQEEGKYPVVSQSGEYIVGYSNDATKIMAVDRPVVVFGDHTREVKYIKFDFVPGADGIKVLWPYPSVSPRYFYTALCQYDLRNRGYGRHYKVLKDQLFPLPPLAEQERIVAKVDALMAQCDRLEAQQAEREETRAFFSEATLGRLQRAEESELAERWAFTREHFDRVASRAEDVQALRQTLLQLAVEGKLTEQVPSDEPAEKLLERIEAEKQRLYEAGEIRKPKNVEDVKETSDGLPTGWRRTRMANLMYDWGTGLQRAKKEQSLNYPYHYFKMDNIGPSGECLPNGMTKVEAAPEEVEKYELKHGDFLFNTRNSTELVGKTCVFRDDEERTVLYNNNILRIDFGQDVSQDYINAWRNSAAGRKALDACKSSTTNVAAIYQKDLLRVVLPVPPLAEQERIVAKVDQLMAFCDELEAKLERSQETTGMLLDAVLHAAPEEESEPVPVAA